MAIRSLEWFDSLSPRDFENGAVIDEIRSVFREREERFLAMAEAAEGLKKIVSQMETLPGKWQPMAIKRSQWYPRSILPTEQGYYYVRGTSVTKVGIENVRIRYFDDSDQSWRLPSLSWQPNNSFAEWLFIGGFSQCNSAHEKQPHTAC